MTDEKKTQDKDRIQKQELKDAPRDQENLDEGLEESMDGSDTPSALQP